MYRYPDVWMCLYDYYGCDEKELEKQCVASANRTEGGPVRAIYHPGGEHEQNIPTYYTKTNMVRTTVRAALSYSVLWKGDILRLKILRKNVFIAGDAVIAIWVYTGVCTARSSRNFLK